MQDEDLEGATERATEEARNAGRHRVILELPSLSLSLLLSSPIIISRSSIVFVIINSRKACESEKGAACAHSLPFLPLTHSLPALI